MQVTTRVTHLMIPLMIFEAKVTMPPRGIEMKPHQVTTLKVALVPG